MTIPRGAELWRMVLESRLLDVHTALPAKVVSFSATDQTVTVQPLIKNVVTDPDGNELVESYPQLRDIPVLYPRAGGFFIAFPLAADDIVTVLFNEWPIDNFRAKGREDHPIQLDRHAFGGAVALPMGPHKESDTISETIDSLIIGYDGGAIVRIADDGTVTIGASGATTQPVALGDDVKGELDKIATDVNNLKTAISGWVPVPNDGGAALKTALSSWYGSSLTMAAVGSTKIEVEE